jgi:2,3-bisphosphoglycerate-dependent phosphoglycerate mutase
MQTIIYFVRHAEVDYIPDDYSRPLSQKGMLDAIKLTERFSEYEVSRVFSSPYLRAVNTVKGIAEMKGIKIETIEDFRERKVSNGHIEDFFTYAERQWNDFDYRLEEGESLNQTQERVMKAVNIILERHSGESIVIGTHGTALGVILNYFNKKYDFNFWKTIKMPDIFMFVFNKKEIIEITNV